MSEQNASRAGHPSHEAAQRLTIMNGVHIEAVDARARRTAEHLELDQHLKQPAGSDPSSGAKPNATLFAITGQRGDGKTVLAHALAADAGCDLIMTLDLEDMTWTSTTAHGLGRIVCQALRRGAAVLVRITYGEALQRSREGQRALRIAREQVNRHGGLVITEIDAAGSAGTGARDEDIDAQIDIEPASTDAIERWWNTAVQCSRDSIERLRTAAAHAQGLSRRRLARIAKRARAATDAGTHTGIAALDAALETEGLAPSGAFADAMYHDRETAGQRED